jgi:uncharacterized membrane protein YedE/YeeE
MQNFTPLPALLGGLLIGLAAALLWIANGRIAGISGIFGGLLRPARGDAAWRLAFVAGLIAAPLLLAAAAGAPMIVIGAAPRTLIVGGLLVGFGTRLGGGCTSGHGVCGLARLSRRSMTATCVFVAAAAATVFVARHGLGGWL